MEAQIVDIETIRRSRMDKLRLACQAFGRLPCPLCDVMTVAVEFTGERARFVCDNGGQHEHVEWTADSFGEIFDHQNRVRHFYTY